MSQEQDRIRSAADQGGPSASPAPDAAVRPEVVARLAARRQWFRSFPDGSLEFVAAIRIVWILAFFVVPVIGGFMRVFAALGIAALLVLDFGLVMTWLVQMATDRDDWIRPGAPDGRHARRSGKAVMAIPVTAQALLVAFLAMSLLPLPLEVVRTHPGAMATARWAILALYAAAVVAMVRAYRSAALPGGVWTILLAVPLLNWWAVRRLAAGIGAGMVDDAARASKRPPSLPRTAFVMANAAWMVLVAMTLATALLAKDMWTHVTWQGACCGIIVAAAAIADMAALESVQRVYLAWLRTVQPTRARDATPA